MITKILKTKINSEYIIVDVEIGNDLSPNWIYKNADIITLGILKGNEIKIIQREKTDNLEEFKIVLRDILKDIKKFYSFNFKFERGALFGFLGEEYNVKEIKPFLGKLWSKEKFFNELLGIIKIENEINNSFTDGSLVQGKYQESKYNEIINHNTNCLIKEAYIKKYRNEIIEKYKHKINSDGWIEEEKIKKTFDKTNWDKEPATERQLSYLIELGCSEIPKNKLEASKLIDLWKNTNQNETTKGYKNNESKLGYRGIYVYYDRDKDPSILIVAGNINQILEDNKLLSEVHIHESKGNLFILVKNDYNKKNEEKTKKILKEKLGDYFSCCGDEWFVCFDDKEPFPIKIEDSRNQSYELKCADWYI